MAVLSIDKELCRRILDSDDDTKFEYTVEVTLGYSANVILWFFAFLMILVTIDECRDRLGGYFTSKKKDETESSDDYHKL